MPVENPKYKRTAPPIPREAPAWAQDARWYAFDLDDFASPPSAGRSTSSMDRQTPDRSPTAWEAIRRTFPYLKALGINVLYLQNVFHRTRDSSDRDTDFRHVRTDLGPSRGTSDLEGESFDPRTWTWSTADRAFLRFVKTAHKTGFRVVVQADFHRSDQMVSRGALFNHLAAAARRWIRPGGEGERTRGVDGFVSHDPRVLSADFWRLLRRSAKQLEPDTLLIGVPARASDAGLWREGDTFDAVWQQRLTESLLRFFGDGPALYPPEAFLSDLESMVGRHRLDQELAGPIALLGPDGGPFLIALERRFRQATTELYKLDKPKTRRGDIRMWRRLAVILQYTLPGAPVIVAGHELGSDGLDRLRTIARRKPSGEHENAPLQQDEDLPSLIQWLGYRRDHHAPLRSGAFRPVLADGKREILAFARELPGERVIVVLNLNGKRQQVIIPAGKPGTMVGILTPQLHPVRTKQGVQPPFFPNRKGPIAPLRVTGTRQFLDTGGHATFWIEPVNVALVVVQEKAP
ncbi:MAG: hypothetical protein D6788_12050 [Planctomycetota bacterium]|nr:MAG: hypothetical protein D6788_12050 [Planctomycetota bacterium]